jgi:hypothetical protein
MLSWSLIHNQIASRSNPLIHKKFLLAVLLLCAALSGSCTHANAGMNELPIGNIDRPAENVALHNPTVFAGWAAHPSGIQAVAVYVDGHYLTKADLDTKRPDVQATHPQYSSSMIAGWDVIAFLNGVTPGEHLFTVKLRSNAGPQRDYSFKAVVTQ